MNKTLVPLVVIPTIVLVLVSIARSWFEFESPDSAIMPFLSVSILSLVWMLFAPAVMLRRGLSLVQGLASAAIVFVVHRAFVGAAYATAWADQSKVEGSDEFVRYVTDIRNQVGDGEAPSTMTVFLSTTFIPVAFGLVVVLLIWSITWAIGFRGKRPFARGVAA